MLEEVHPTITIKVDGKPALTIDMIATRHGLTPANARKIVSRAPFQPVAHIDQRTPLYSTAVVDRYMANRPGRGRRAAQ